jgi:uncharacterized membrane protein YoaK (UPF0700 family)
VDSIVKRDLSRRSRDQLVVLLTLPTGAVDAACFLHLGHVFSSVVTGTMVLLGVAAGSRDSGLAIHCAVALASYTSGVVIGAPIAGRSSGQRPAGATGPRDIWPQAVTVALAAEFCILAAFCVGWELRGGRPHGSSQLVLLALVAVSMGIQAAAVRQLGEMSTTYLTGTLTGIVAVLATRQKPEGLARSLGVFAALIVGAVISATVAAYAPGWLPLVVLLPLAVVLALSATRSRSGAFTPRRRGRLSPGGLGGP